MSILTQLVLIAFACGTLSICLEGSLLDSKFDVDPTDSQVLYIAGLANVQFNLIGISGDNATSLAELNATYTHLSEVLEAQIQVSSGIVWRLRTRQTPTNCSMDSIDLENTSWQDLGAACQVDASEYDKYICFIEAKVLPGELDFDFFTFGCVL